MLAFSYPTTPWYGFIWKKLGTQLPYDKMVSGGKKAQIYCDWVHQFLKQNLSQNFQFWNLISGSNIEFLLYWYNSVANVSIWWKN